MVPPRGPALGFCCGARLARVVAPAKEGWGCTPYPAFRARSLPPPQAAAKRSIHPPEHLQQADVPSRRQASRSPAVRFASTGRAVCAGLTRRWGRSISRPSRSLSPPWKPSHFRTCPSTAVPVNAVRGTTVHAEAEDGLRVHSRAPDFVRQLTHHGRLSSTRFNRTRAVECDVGACQAQNEKPCYRDRFLRQRPSTDRRIRRCP